MERSEVKGGADPESGAVKVGISVPASEVVEEGGVMAREILHLTLVPREA